VLATFVQVIAEYW